MNPDLQFGQGFTARPFTSLAPPAKRRPVHGDPAGGDDARHLGGDEISVRDELRPPRPGRPQHPGQQQLGVQSVRLWPVPLPAGGHVGSQLHQLSGEYPPPLPGPHGSLLSCGGAAPLCSCLIPSGGPLTRSQPRLCPTSSTARRSVTSSLVWRSKPPGRLLFPSLTSPECRANQRAPQPLSLTASTISALTPDPPSPPILAQSLLIHYCRAIMGGFGSSLTPPHYRSVIISSRR